MNFAGPLGSLRKHFPQWNEILTVFSFVAFAVFSWALFAFLNHLPSSLLNVSLPEIAVLFCFELAIALLESLFVCGLIVLLAVISPRRWLREGFACKGFLIALAWGLASILSSRFTLYPAQPSFLAVLALCLIVLIAAIILVDKYPNLRKLLLAFVNRFDIFSYIYLPLGIIGVIVVLIRNVF
jgi:hypothetical protein